MHELEFFNNRLKVKDLMVRKPATLSVDDTVDTALQKSARFGRSFVPVLDGGKVVGTLSNRDLSDSFRQILGIGEKLFGITLEDDHLSEHAMRDIVSEVDAAGAKLYSLMTLKNPETGKKRLLIRLKADDPDAVCTRLEAKGYRFLEKIKNGM
jgi:acetoin utilization protein AcuB